jgi:hypothetical protein
MPNTNLSETLQGELGVLSTPQRQVLVSAIRSLGGSLTMTKDEITSAPYADRSLSVTEDGDLIKIESF